MRSIQQRLSLGLVSVLLIVGLVLMQTSVWLFDHSLRSYLRAGLKDEAESLLIALVRGPQGLQLDEQRLSAAFQRPYSGLYFRIDLPDVTWRSRSLWDRQLEMAVQPGLQAELGDGPQGQLLLTYRADYQRFGQQLSIHVARDYTPVLQSFRRVERVGLGLGVGALVLILLLQRVTVNRALRPLEKVRLQIAQLQQGQRSELDRDVPQELEALVAQVNHLLTHTEDTLKRSRNALGNLGHALKTPLAVLVSLADREDIRRDPVMHRTLVEQLEQIEQRLTRELGRARLTGEALPGAHFDCAEELPGLVATLAMIHDDGVQLTWQAEPGLRLPWDREDLLELLGNLLDNACKWADSEVALSITRTPQGFVLKVEDDGPGIEAERRDAVLSRGTRLDEQVAGHGLGLGIVRDIVEAWSGRLSLNDSPLGGLCVEVVLPLRAH
ncbi:MAG: ATP-binding protein [Gammaproteobacteria bacterium]|nr:ATP-binding protein [Gammaproteobacteria bacterium]MBU2067611.1 ATP-binding protein [Gammaproteobacteria bacterium]MBU2138916.1 ATP-binding protein [Gammaproteobacteria bacterium]MBU2216885.1 ATP-binding protein [Gammaproteobacteria bacterium]MBU2325694.1 ATP-binding protein [Gammaproteobacteria bacterium]